MKFIFGETGSRKATIRVTIDAGAAVEYPNVWTSGIAHLVEHMIFQGTNNCSHAELTRALATLGADFNAATWHDKVSFFITVPAENIVQASMFLKDMLLDRKFKEDLFEKEKFVVLEEERGSRDDIDSNVIEELDGFLCKGPLAEPIIGTEESIKSITLEEVQEFHRFYYQPDRMLVVVTGPKDVDCKAIAELFGGDTGKFKRAKKKKALYTKTKRHIMCDSRIQQSRLFICYRAFPISDKRSLVLNFVDKFFSEDMDSRLFQSLRQKRGLCYSVGSFVSFYKDVGWYIVWTRTSPENISKSVKLVNNEINLLLKDGPTEEEIVRARNKYMSQIYGYIETSYGLNAMLSGKAYNNLPPLSDTIERMKAMDSKKIRSTCGKVFKKGNRQIFVCNPEKDE